MWEKRSLKTVRWENLESFAFTEREILAPRYSTRYSPARNGDVPGGVVHHNVRFSDVIPSGISELKSPSDSCPFKVLFYNYGLSGPCRTFRTFVTF